MLNYLLGAVLLGFYIPCIQHIRNIIGIHWSNLLTLIISSWLFFLILHYTDDYSTLEKISWAAGAALLFTINHWIVSLILKNDNDGV